MTDIVADARTEAIVPGGGLGDILDGPLVVGGDPAWVDDPVGNLSRGGRINGVSPSSVEKQKKVAAGQVHVVAEVRFGPGRFTTCTGCDFRATGDTDDAMAALWNSHPPAVRRARHAAEFPVEIVVPGSAAA